MNIDEAIEAKAYKDGYEAGKRDSVADNLSATALKWIPVSERLPEQWVNVLVWSWCGYCEVAVYLGIPGKWRVTWNHDMIDNNTITHWMPLPEPPNEYRKCQEI